MNRLIGIFFVLIISLITTSIYAWMAGHIFEWVLIPLYGIPAPSFKQMLVLLYLYRAVKYTYDDSNLDWDEIIKHIIITVIVSFVLFGLAALIYTL